MELVSINTDQTVVVSLDTVVEFSDNSLKSTKELVLKYKDRLAQLGAVSNGLLNETEFLPTSASGANIKWSEVSLNEDQAAFLLTLLKNSESVVEFKFNLIKSFKAARTTIANIREQSLVDYHKDEIAKVRAEKKKLRTYDNGMMSVSKIQKEFDVDVSLNVIWEALEHAGLSYSEKIHQTYRRLSENVPNYVGDTMPGSQTPMYIPNAVIQAVKTYKEYLMELEEEE